MIWVKQVVSEIRVLKLKQARLYFFVFFPDRSVIILQAEDAHGSGEPWASSPCACPSAAQDQIKGGIIIMSGQRERLGSRLSFIFLSAGCAIGCGNVWKFPWMAG